MTYLAVVQSTHSSNLPLRAILKCGQGEISLQVLFALEVTVASCSSVV